MQPRARLLLQLDTTTLFISHFSTIGPVPWSIPHVFAAIDNMQWCWLVANVPWTSTDTSTKESKSIKFHWWPTRNETENKGLLQTKVQVKTTRVQGHDRRIQKKRRAHKLGDGGDRWSFALGAGREGATWERVGWSNVGKRCFVAGEPAKLVAFGADRQRNALVNGPFIRRTEPFKASEWAIPVDNPNPEGSLSATTLTTALRTNAHDQLAPSSYPFDSLPLSSTGPANSVKPPDAGDFINLSNHDSRALWAFFSTTAKFTVEPVHEGTLSPWVYASHNSKC